MEAIAQVQAELGGVPLADRAVAESLDQRDPLQLFREFFIIPSDGTAIYLCGHSLGPMPRATPGQIERVLSQWGQEAVLGWFSGTEPLKDADKSVLEDLAALLGASASETVAMLGLSVNLHLMLAAFYRPTETRYQIIVEEGAFPSDMHAVRSQLAVVHPDYAAREDALLVLPRRPGESTWRPADVLQFIQQHGEQTALVFLSGVHYATGQCFDMKAITRVAHERGCVVGFDLAHAVGNVELRLHDWGVDFAVICTYKYLSAGPGAVGGCFVHARHADGADGGPARLAGWWGQNEQDRFSFAEPEFRPAPGALGFQLSTPSPMQLTALGASLAIFREAGGMAPIRAKSVVLTAYLEALLETTGLTPDHVRIVTPRDPAQRGCQLSLTFEAGARAVDAATVLAGLQARGVVADVRKPNIIRVAPYPLYTRYVDVLRFVQTLKEVLLCSTMR